MSDFNVTPIVEPKEETFADRLRKEHTEVFDRVQKLGAFIDTTPFYALTTEDQADLKVQYTYMTGYVGVLAKRLNRLSSHH